MPGGTPTVDGLGSKLHQTLGYELGHRRGISFLEMLSQRTTNWVAHTTEVYPYRSEGQRSTIKVRAGPGAPVGLGQTFSFRFQLLALAEFRGYGCVAFSSFFTVPSRPCVCYLPLLLSLQALVMALRTHSGDPGHLFISRCSIYYICEDTFPKWGDLQIAGLGLDTWGGLSSTYSTRFPSPLLRPSPSPASTPSQSGLLPSRKGTQTQAVSTETELGWLKTPAWLDLFKSVLLLLYLRLISVRMGGRGQLHPGCPGADAEASVTFLLLLYPHNYGP